LISNPYVAELVHWIRFYGLVHDVQTEHMLDLSCCSCPRLIGC